MMVDGIHSDTHSDTASDGPLQEILAKLARQVEEHPPTIGVVGVSGVGKSSTINALFKTRLGISDTVARTKQFEDVDLGVNFNLDSYISDPPSRDAGPESESKPQSQQKVRLRMVDAPGLGEDLARDDGYLELYRRELPRCDVILWVIATRNRAIALDQMYLRELADFHGRIVFGISQADLVEPLDWRDSFNIPSRAQEDNLKKIILDRSAHLASVIGRDPTIIDYSARYGYHLEQLFSALIEACPEDRQWIFQGLKNFSYLDFVPADKQRGLAFRGARMLARMSADSNKRRI
jgi:hypothetical protein